MPSVSAAYVIRSLHLLFENSVAHPVGDHMHAFGLQCQCSGLTPDQQTFQAINARNNVVSNVWCHFIFNMEDI